MSRKLLLSSVVSVVLMAVVPQIITQDSAAAQTLAEAGGKLFHSDIVRAR